MNLQDLTQAAAIVSSLAVVVSLIYASVQLRHNTRALMATTYNAVTSNSLALLSPMTGSPEFSEFLHHAHAQPDALMPAERMRFDAVMLTVFRHWDNLYYQFRSGTLDPEMWDIYERTLTRWLAQESWANRFLDNADSCSDSLRALLHDRLARRGAGRG